MYSDPCLVEKKRSRRRRNLLYPHPKFSLGLVHIILSYLVLFEYDLLKSDFPSLYSCFISAVSPVSIFHMTSVYIQMLLHWSCTVSNTFHLCWPSSYARLSSLLLGEHSLYTSVRQIFCCYLYMYRLTGIMKSTIFNCII